MRFVTTKTRRVGTMLGAKSGKSNRELPAIHNADLARKLQSIVRGAQGRISWEALGWTIETSHLLSSSR
jgi:hypothetical protein